MKSWLDSPIIDKCQGYICSWMALWYFVFPLAFYLNPSKGGTANIFYLGILFPWCLLLFMGKVKLWYQNSFYISTVLLFFYLWLNSLWGDNNSVYDIAYFFKWFVYVICLLTAPVLITERFPNFFEKLLLFVYCAAVLGAALIIFLHINKFSAASLQMRLGGWGYGYNPIALGLHQGMAILIGLFLIDRYKTKVIWIGLASLLPLSAMMLTHSRGPMIALLICVFMALFLFKRSRSVIFIKIALLGFALAATAYIGLDRLLERGFSSRPEIWAQVWLLVKDSIVFGEGYSLEASRILIQEHELNHSHNVFVELLRYGGLVAVLLFTCQLLMLFRFQIKKGDSLSSYYMVILCFTILVMLTSGWYLLDRPNYFWIGYWYPIGLVMVMLHKHSMKHDK